MTILHYLIPALIVIALAVLLSRRGKSDDTPAPRVTRTDLRFGYYGTYGDQVAETADHTNLHWSTGWESEEKRFADIRAAGQFTVLDLTGELFYRTGPKQMLMHADAVERARGLFGRLRDAGVLQYVRAAVPIDEPNLPEHNVGHLLPQAVQAIRTAAADFAELAGLQLWCLYYNGNPHPHPELFDVIGFDDYDRGARILAPDGQYDQIIAGLRPGQSVFLVPGGSYGQDPAPFVAYAMRRPEVAAIVTFLWHYPPHGEWLSDVRSLPIRAAYEAAGRQITESSK